MTQAQLKQVFLWIVSFHKCLDLEDSLRRGLLNYVLIQIFEVSLRLTWQDRSHAALTVV